MIHRDSVFVISGEKTVKNNRISRMTILGFLFFLLQTPAFGGSFQKQAESNKSGQSELRKRCEKMLRKSIAEMKSKDSAMRSGAIYFILQMPYEFAEKHVLELLDLPDPNFRVFAAEYLVRHSKNRHKKRILSALSKIETKDISLKIRMECLKMKMGDPKAIKNVLAIVKGSSKLIPKLDVWTCAMCPEVRRHANGECPICEMKLVKMSKLRTDQDKQGQVIALAALSEIGHPKVAQLAREMLTDDFNAHQRLEIAKIWVQTEPKKGWPHFRIFLHSSNSFHRFSALNAASRFFPELCVREFKAILNDSTRSTEEKFYATEGLAITEKSQYIATIRGYASKKDSGNSNSLSSSDMAKYRAIHFLEEHGDESDIELLKPVLDEKNFPVIAARAILTIMYRWEKK